MKKHIVHLLALLINCFLIAAESLTPVLTIISSDNVEFVVNKSLFLKHSTTFKELHQWPDGIVEPYQSLFNAQVISALIAAIKTINDQEKTLPCQTHQLVFYPFAYTRAALDKLFIPRLQEINEEKNTAYATEEQFITDLMHASLFFDIPQLNKYFAYIIAKKALSKNHSEVNEDTLNQIKIKSISEHGISLINKQLLLLNNKLSEYTVADYLVEHGQPSLLTIARENNKTVSQLNLSGQSLTSLFGLSCIHNAHKIDVINLSNNNILKIEKDQFSSFPSLKALNLDNNLLEVIPAFSFVGCKQLQQLSLAHNRIRLIYPDAFWGLEQLTALNMKRNFITYLAKYMFFDCKKLQRLWLEYNNIEDIKPGAFDDLDNLVFVNLITNKIKKIPEDLFKNTMHLKEIYLMGNELVRFSPELIAHLQLQTLNLTYNRLSSANVQELQAMTHIPFKTISPQKE